MYHAIHHMYHAQVAIESLKEPVYIKIIIASVNIRSRLVNNIHIIVVLICYHAIK